MPKQYILQPVLGHSPMQPIVIPNLVAFDQLWNLIANEVSNWAGLQDDRKSKHVIVFFRHESFLHRLPKIVAEVLARNAKAEPH